MQLTWRKTGYAPPSPDGGSQCLGNFPCPEKGAERLQQLRTCVAGAAEKNQFDKKGGGSKMNSKTRQKRSLCHLGRLCRRAVALTLVLAMLLPTAAFGFDAMQKPTIVADSGEFPTITVEANAVVDRWFDPTGPESAADYLTGYLEVAIRVKSGVKGGRYRRLTRSLWPCTTLRC